MPAAYFALRCLWPQKHSKGKCASAAKAPFDRGIDFKETHFVERRNVNAICFCCCFIIMNYL